MRTINECHKNDIWTGIVTVQFLIALIAPKIRNGEPNRIQRDASSNLFNYAIIGNVVSFHSILEKETSFREIVTFRRNPAQSIGTIDSYPSVKTKWRKKNTFSVDANRVRDHTLEILYLTIWSRGREISSNMLVKALARPLINNICKVPSRSTSAIVGVRTNHVSVMVSAQSHRTKNRIDFRSNLHQ